MSIGRKKTRESESNTKRIAMFSGGKDSAATIIVMRKLGILPDLVIFSEVMFDNKRGIGSCGRSLLCLIKKRIEFRPTSNTTKPFRK